jgi:predicted DNA binding CopG/RHH family protein
MTDQEILQENYKEYKKRKKIKKFKSKLFEKCSFSYDFKSKKVTVAQAKSFLNKYKKLNSYKELFLINY